MKFINLDTTTASSPAITTTDITPKYAIPETTAYYTTPEKVPNPEPRPEPELISNSTGALTCFHCDAPNFKDCEKLGAYKTCAHNEQSCMIEVRRRGPMLENVSSSNLARTF